MTHLGMYLREKQVKRMPPNLGFLAAQGYLNKITNLWYSYIIPLG